MHLTENLIVPIQVYIVMHLHVYNLVSNVHILFLLQTNFLLTRICVMTKLRSHLHNVYLQC